MGNIKQYHDITFPLRQSNDEGLFLDLNEDPLRRLESDLAHVILTPKGTKIRRPDFGTNLIKLIYEPNDSITEQSVLSEIHEAINRYVSNVTLNNVTIMETDGDDHTKALKLEYSVKRGNSSQDRSTLIKL